MSIFKGFGRRFSSRLGCRLPYSTTPKFPVFKSMIVTGLTAAGLWAYYRHEKGKLDRLSTHHWLVSDFNVALEEAKRGSMGTPKVGGPFRLTTHLNEPFSFPEDLEGSFALIYFGFTHCPDICPEELEKISQALRILEREDPKLSAMVKPLFITCDPERDSPAMLKEYLEDDFHPSVIGLTGEMADVKETAKLFRVYFKAAKTSNDPQQPNDDYLVDHSIFYYLMDPEGKFVTHFGRETSPEACAQTIKEQIVGWKSKVATTDSRK